MIRGIRANIDFMLLDITEIIVTSQILKCVYRNQNRKGVTIKCQLHFCRRFSTFPLNLFAEFTLVLSIFPKILHIFHAVHRIFVSLAMPLVVISGFYP